MSTNTHRTPLWLLPLAAALALAACDRREVPATGDLSPETGATTPVPSDTPPATAAMPATVMPPAAATVGATGATLNAADTAFIGEVNKANEEEIATTALGMERGNARNKELSRMLNADHVALRGQVAALTPNAAPPRAGMAPASLRDLREEAFDAKLLSVLREQHEGAIDKFTAASNDMALTEPVRSLAKQTLPKLQSHLQSVKDAQAGR